MCVCMHVCMHACMHVCTYVCMYVCMLVHRGHIKRLTANDTVLPSIVFNMFLVVWLCLWLTVCMVLPEKQIEVHRREIDALKIQLQDERLIRRHKEEYEALATVINSFTARDLTEKYATAFLASLMPHLFWSQFVFREHPPIQRRCYTPLFDFVFSRILAFGCHSSFSWCSVCPVHRCHSGRVGSCLAGASKC
jgi:hypothetical protein